ncbi:hypothetical protein V6U81_18820 [Micromonospora sp. CPCC 205711]|uniref:hypothetical protein n=1 Tax=Micromonospora sp. CPCC 205547 TaxID=3122400 RepID=UPI002FF3C03D
MRVTFERPRDHERGTALIERDDGVVYRMDGGPVTGAEIPHDLIHFETERTLGMSDGVWGAIASGVVFRSMRHVGGRRPPHAAERSHALVRAHRDALRRAELAGGVVERLLSTAEPTPEVRDAIAVMLGGLPDLDLIAARRAAEAVREAGARWSALPVGAGLVLDWPARLRLPAAAARPGRDRRPATRRR